MNAVLYDFRVEMPALYLPQERTLNWLAAAHSEAEHTTYGKARAESRPRMERLVRRFGCSPKDIGFRASEVQDFQHFSWREMSIFNLHQSPRGTTLDARNKFFADAVSRIVFKFYEGTPMLRLI
jgi:hypothetical protein